MPIPTQQAAVVDDKRVATPDWWRYFKELNALVAAGATSAEVAAAIKAIATALGSPDGSIEGIPNLNATITGAGPIQVVGSLASGHVTVTGRQIVDSGVGAALVKLTRDAYGRVAGTEAATAADLPYVNTTSGLTADDVQAAIDEVAAGGGGILPMVNGEVPPVLMYFDDGSLLYAAVE